MGYQALLFCPDERTARTVTQVLSELEFSVEAATEPFAAVKKLMGQHFDAVVVDCDNEQNASLLFKSARNSASNQASLAVAVVEGQAGVAKAFRIGANLVLTKPINIEQTKGTLRVARGLLRKGEPAKPGAPATTTPAAAAPATIPASTSAAPKPAPKRILGGSPAVAAQRPAAPPASSQPSAKIAPAASTPVAQNDILPAINSAAEFQSEKPAATPVPKPAPAPVAAKVPAAPIVEPKPILKSAPAAPAFASGAASAPAPAREAAPAEIAKSSSAGIVVDEPRPSEPAERQTSPAPEPSFTFGGANTPEGATGFKKFLIPVAASVVLAAAYAGWTYLHGNSASPKSAAQTPTAVKPNPAPVHTPAITAAAPAPPSVAQPTTTGTPANTVAVNPAPADNSSISDDGSSGSAQSAKKASTSSTKTSAAKSAGGPLLVKGGTVPKAHLKMDAPDTSAPSIGIAVPTASAPPAGLLGGDNSTPAPVLQNLNISQGVSQGLLYKKVAPVYPPTAVAMRIEGQVELKATISKTGNITTVKVLSGNPNLTKAAVDAVKQWKYKPYLLDGEPVEIQTQVTINFKLPN